MLHVASANVLLPGECPAAQSDLAHATHVAAMPDPPRGTLTEPARSIVEVDDLALLHAQHTLGKGDGIWVQHRLETLQLCVLYNQAEPVLIPAWHHTSVIKVAYASLIALKASAGLICLPMYRHSREVPIPMHIRQASPML